MTPWALTRGRWWIDRPEVALRLWCAAFVVGLASAVVAVAAVLVRLLQWRRDATGVEQGVAAELLTAAVVAVVIALTSWSLGRSEREVVRGRRTRATVGCLGSMPGTREVRHEGTRVMVVESAQPFAVAARAEGRHVVVSSGLWDRLTDPERSIVIRHENAHLAGRHDLVVGLGAIVFACSPWVPASRRMRREIDLLVELIADDHSCRGGDAGTAASALLKTGGPSCRARAARLARRAAAPA